jgi:hypothetical protein
MKPSSARRLYYATVLKSVCSNPIETYTNKFILKQALTSNLQINSKRQHFRHVYWGTGADLGRNNYHHGALQTNV